VDLGLTDDQRTFHETTRRYLADSCPIATVRTWADSEPAGYPARWWRQGAELGWTSLLVPDDLGGGNVSGNGLVDASLVAEEVGRAVAPGPLLPTNVVLSALARGGAAFASVIDDLVPGRTVAAWCFGAEAAGVKPPGRVRAVPSPDGGLVLHGESGPVEGAAQAGVILVTAVFDGGDGLAQCLLDLRPAASASAPGSVGPDGPAGLSGLERLAAGSLDLVRRYSGLRFDGVVVPATAVVGRPGAVAGDIERQVQEAAVLQAAEMVGAVTRMFELTVAYAFDRYSFGRPLASYQALKHRFADMKLWLEAATASAAAAARAVGAGSPDAAELASVAKAYVVERSLAMGQDCIQLHGGIGVTWDHDLHLYLRRLVQDASQWGTASEHRERVAVLAGIDGDTAARQMAGAAR
jgi:alkylation response protein AidB-like acyl-CoA dehydrogenase